MDAGRFDRISQYFGRRQRSFHAAQEATPESQAGTGGRTTGFLFVQTFQAGAIATKEGAEGRFTLTLESGSGQTVFFSDRPTRIVGAHPTPEFLERLGFPDDNPPNAALVFEKAPGETDVAVVELFAPVYDGATRGMTYEVETLQNWEAELGVGLHEAPADVATAAPSFGAAHLFIDGEIGCPGGEVDCIEVGSNVHQGTISGSSLDGYCGAGLLVDGTSTYINICVPCTTPVEERRFRTVDDVRSYWTGQCNAAFSGCNGNCLVSGWCNQDSYFQDACPPLS